MPVPRPRFQVRELTARAIVWDGQTVVLFGGEPFQASNPPQGETPATETKRLLVFVTATLIDAKGNRVHADDELPPAPKGTTPQNAR